MSTHPLRSFALVLFPALLSAQAPPRPFTQQYGDALRDVISWNEAVAAHLERRLSQNPEDLVTRLKIMAYEARADRASSTRDLTARIAHTLWLIQHHPDSEILHSYVSHFSARQLPSPDRARAAALWAAASQARPHDPAIQWNAASFFEGIDLQLHLHYLETTAIADPNHPFALRPLAFLYANSILEPGPLTAAALRGLESSKNMWVLSNAAYVFQSGYNLSLQRHAPNPEAARLAERYFLRAQAIDPKLERNVILPQLPPQGPPPPPSPVIPDDAVTRIRRLPVDAFPNLPPAIAAVLRARHCTVPQPALTGAPRNVIRGDFMARNESGWAVLCSVKTSTTLLVFRNNADQSPQSIATSPDLAYLQLEGNRVFYQHEIMTANRDFILRHYRAYGGPPPPPIDHSGIDDSFLEKASVTWYFHDGKWLRLQGAD